MLLRKLKCKIIGYEIIANILLSCYTSALLIVAVFLVFSFNINIRGVSCRDCYSNHTKRWRESRNKDTCNHEDGRSAL